VQNGGNDLIPLSPSQRGKRVMAELDRWPTLSMEEVPFRMLLLVDDDAETAKFVKQVFEPHGVTVRVAKDGGQAQSSFVMHKPDLVVLDLILPGESGFEICERMKHTNDTVPVLALTAIDMDDSRALADRVGVDGYLTKPVNAETIMGTAAEVVKKVWRRVHHIDSGEADGDRVRFTCPCGKKFKVSAAHRGKSMTCPQCGEPLVVPKR
jgi:two-component system, OmpR family, response regulator